MGDVSVHMAAEAPRTDGPLMEGEHSERETGQAWKLEVLEGKGRSSSSSSTEGNRKCSVSHSVIFDKRH